MNTLIRALVPGILLAMPSIPLIPSMAVGQVVGGSDQGELNRMSDPDQWPAPGSAVVRPAPGNSTHVNPLGLPSPLGTSAYAPEYTMQKPELGDYWQRQIPSPPRANLRIPQGLVGFYNVTTQPASFALSVDGEKRPHVHLGPEEFMTVSCGRCDDGAWAAIGTDSPDSQPSKAKLSSQSFLILAIDGGQWKLIPSSLASMSISVPGSPVPRTTGVFIGAR
jgi:hypothetical protein